MIRTPHDHIILIDTGGELEHGGGTTSNAERAGARIVLAYLRRAGIRAIDLMLLTHPHGDHVRWVCSDYRRDAGTDAF